ncbi:MAG: hypothetical protein ACKVK6_08340 [bacterium]
MTSSSVDLGLTANDAKLTVAGYVIEQKGKHITAESEIAFDELDNPLWPGETEAMVEFCKEHKLRIQRLPFDPYVGYAVID